MLIGVVAFFPDNPLLMKKFSGISAIENFIRIKEEYITTPPFVLLAESEDVADMLNKAFSDRVAKCTRDKLTDTVAGSANFLAATHELEVKRVTREAYSQIPEIYVVFSDESDKLTQDYFEQLQWFEDFNAALQNLPALRHSIRLCINSALEDGGVEFLDINSTYIDYNVKIGAGTVIYPNVIIEGESEIGANCVIGAGCNLRNTKIGDACVLQSVFATDAVVDRNVSIGPFVNLRPNTHVHENCKIGDFVEIKNSNIGAGTKLPHLSYIGDADVGERVNVGCGSIFVNYDGKNKMRTIVGNDVFIGCNSNLVAPISVGNGVYIAAGSTITDNVPDGTMAIARAKQVNKVGWIPPYLRKKD